MAWEINKTDELWEWFQGLDRATQVRVIEAVDMLAEIGPALGRPLVDTLKGTRVANLKELRPGSSGRSEVRVLFAFDPWREAILLIGGDKSGNWSGWYHEWIPWAEARYEQYLKERQEETER